MIYQYLPKKISSVLWGNRDKYGFIPDFSDDDWKIWLEKGYSDFYQTTQLKGLGSWVNRLSLSVISKVNFKDTTVLEIGPGMIRHLSYMNAKPNKYIICDHDQHCLEMSADILKKNIITFEAELLKDNFQLPFKDSVFDIIISFNSLEHLHPLDDYLQEMKRVMKKDGFLVGGMPCEGGLAWGLGRYFTTRRYVHKNYGINYDKIICWEHPNFADFIFKHLGTFFIMSYKKYHPFRYLPMDCNLVASFIYQK